MSTPVLPTFDRRSAEPGTAAHRIGGGGLGGKALGLIAIQAALGASRAAALPGIAVGIPRMVVIGTDVFDAFLRRNQLSPTELAGLSDEGIARAFQAADLPAEFVGDLGALLEQMRVPLAVRSSSALEDSLDRPFAGVYRTKMIPNHQPDPRDRFHRLAEAIKLVYASTYFHAARTYRAAVDVPDASEKMAVIVQELAGERNGTRFYPDVSAVCRSYDYYPPPGARPEEGVVMLALGLGKTIVDGGLCWSYSPARPRARPPFGSTRQLLRETQTRFWAVSLDRAVRYDPIAETEYLTSHSIEDAEYDGTLRYLASTYDAAADRLRPGVVGEAPRVLTFAPLLTHPELPFNDLLVTLLSEAEAARGGPVEIELAATMPRGGRGASVAFLQVRRMATPQETVAIPPEALSAPDLLLASSQCLGNGTLDEIRDVVYTPPTTFQPRHTRAIAADLEMVNDRLLAERRPYLLLGFGRWGSSDPSLGIPVTWGQVAGAKAIVEASLPAMDMTPSQGSHFFHNLSSLQVLYFTVRYTAATPIDWDWLERQAALAETAHVRHVRLSRPLHVRVDGRTGRGIIQRTHPSLQGVP